MEIEIGKVTDFFARPVVAGIHLTDGLQVGDRVHIKGHTTDIEMVVASLQVDNNDVAQAGPGQSIGVKVPLRVRRGDTVFKVFDQST